MLFRDGNRLIQGDINMLLFVFNETILVNHRHRHRAVGSLFLCQVLICVPDHWDVVTYRSELQRSSSYKHQMEPK